MTGGWFSPTDTLGGDGIIVDDETGQTWPTARAMVAWRARANLQGVIEQLILNAIKDKCAKVGAACKAGKALIILLHAESGVWHPNVVARNLPKPLQFENLWVVGPATEGVRLCCYPLGLGGRPRPHLACAHRKRFRCLGGESPSVESTAIGRRFQAAWFQISRQLVVRLHKPAALVLVSALRGLSTGDCHIAQNTMRTCFELTKLFQSLKIYSCQ